MRERQWRVGLRRFRNCAAKEHYLKCNVCQDAAKNLKRTERENTNWNHGCKTTDLDGHQRILSHRRACQHHKLCGVWFELMCLCIIDTPISITAVKKMSKESKISLIKNLPPRWNKSSAGCLTQSFHGLNFSWEIGSSRMTRWMISWLTKMYRYK